MSPGAPSIATISVEPSGSKRNNVVKSDAGKARRLNRDGFEHFLRWRLARAVEGEGLHRELAQQRDRLAGRPDLDSAVRRLAYVEVGIDPQRAPPAALRVIARDQLIAAVLDHQPGDDQQLAALLYYAGAPDHVIAAGALHDTAEKTTAKVADLSARVGARITRLVLALTEDEQPLQRRAHASIVGYGRMRARRPEATDDRRLACLGGLWFAGELAEQSGHDEHRLLSDIDGVARDALQATRDEDHEHRPLAALDVVADLDRAIEDLAVEPVDLPIEADEVLRDRDVTRRERLRGL